MVDASVFIAVERGKLDPDVILQHAGIDETVAIAAVTLSELLQGIHCADTETRRAKRELFVGRATAGLPIIPIDADVARIHARLAAELERTGQTMGAHDLWIACCALTHGAKVLTRDMRSFPRISELPLIAC